MSAVQTRPALRPVTAGEVAKGRPLAVAAYDVACDVPGSGHEHTVITDGRRVVTDGRFGDATRTGTVLEVICTEPMVRDDEQCHSLITVDLAEHGCWRAATDHDVVLLAHGEPVQA